jgi:hypothetical protein
MGQHTTSHWSEYLNYKRVYLVFSNMILLFKSVMHICTNNQQLYLFKNIFTTCIARSSFPTYSVLINALYIWYKERQTCFGKDNKQFFDMFNDLRLEVIRRTMHIIRIEYKLYSNFSIYIQCLKFLNYKFDYSLFFVIHVWHFNFPFYVYRYHSCS